MSSLVALTFLVLGSQQVAYQEQTLPFALRDVKLLAGPFETAHQATAKYLLTLEPEKLLAGFRANSGLKPNAEIYGGWETGGLSGHSLGHFLTACSQEFARTGDERFKAKVDEIVRGLDECQKARPDGFLMAYRFENGFDRARLDNIWAEIAKGEMRSGGFDLNGMWSPWYVHHKVLAGLLDAQSHCGNRQALKVVKKFADWMVKVTANLSEDQWQRMLLCEYGGMNDSLADLYARTKSTKYLDLARKFYDKRVLDPLAEQHDDLAGKHSNTQIPKIIGLAKLHELTGDTRDATIAQFFWDRVVNHHSYAIGGNSNGEYLGEPDRLAHRLSSNTCETCNTYNMLKLTTHLFEWNPSAKLIDFYERAYFNHILGSQDPATGGVTYFMPLATGSHRDYSDPFDNFTCCHGTGMENHTKHAEAAYCHKGKQKLYVNLFIASELNWHDRHTKIRQETDFPKSGKVTLTILEGGGEFEINVRHPGWAKLPVQFNLNNKALEVSSKPSSYFAINRHWKVGDKVEFELPMDLHEESMPDDPNRIALMKGPIVLAADLGDASNPSPRTPVLVTNDRPIADWLKHASTTSEEYVIDEAARPEKLLFYPFYELHHQRYAVYFDKFTQAQWQEAEAEYRAEEARQKDLYSRTVEHFAIGEMQPERDHDLKAERNDVRDVNGRNFRTAMAGGFFEFSAKVDAQSGNELVLTYWGNDRLKPDFSILVDGKLVSSETLTGKPLNRFFDVSYALPLDVTKGQSIVRVRIQPAEGKSGPSVAGVRIVKSHH